MKIIELHSRITTIMKILESQIENNENHDNPRIPHEIHDNHESYKIPCENHENHEIHRIPYENHENHENPII